MPKEKKDFIRTDYKEEYFIEVDTEDHCLLKKVNSIPHYDNYGSHQGLEGDRNPSIPNITLNISVTKKKFARKYGSHQILMILILYVFLTGKGT